MTAPIALFVYNRPAHTRRILEALSRNSLCRESDLFVFSDGPKSEVERDSVEQVRSITRDIRGFRSVSVVKHEQNRGLAESITTGVTQLCEQFGEVVVLEDDLIVAPRFLEFMNWMLQRYRAEERVMQISGYMYPGVFDVSSDVLYLPMISCWGWATWKRAWAYYDPDMGGYNRLVGDPELRSSFNLNGAYDYLGMLEKQQRGEIDSWGIRWHLSVFLHGGLVVYPAHSLVINEGIDGSGTHGRGMAGLQLSSFEEVDKGGPFVLPPAIEISGRALQMVRKKLLASRPRLVERIVRKFLG